jgi:hypothetical protein
MSFVEEISWRLGLFCVKRKIPVGIGHRLVPIHHLAITP